MLIGCEMYRETRGFSFGAKIRNFSYYSFDSARLTQFTRQQSMERVFAEYFADDAKKPLELDVAVLMNVVNHVVVITNFPHSLFSGLALRISFFSKSWTTVDSFSPLLFFCCCLVSNSITLQGPRAATKGNFRWFWDDGSRRPVHTTL